MSVDEGAVKWTLIEGRPPRTTLARGEVVIAQRDPRRAEHRRDTQRGCSGLRRWKAPVRRRSAGRGRADASVRNRVRNDFLDLHTPIAQDGACRPVAADLDSVE